MEKKAISNKIAHKPHAVKKNRIKIEPKVQEAETIIEAIIDVIEDVAEFVMEETKIIKKHYGNLRGQIRR